MPNILLHSHAILYLVPCFIAYIIDVCNGLTLFDWNSSPFVAGRYHSLVIDRETFPSHELEITAWTDDGLIMGIRHKTYRHIQVMSSIILSLRIGSHPESIIFTFMFCFWIGCAVPSRERHNRKWHADYGEFFEYLAEESIYTKIGWHLILYIISKLLNKII